MRDGASAAPASAGDGRLPQRPSVVTLGEVLVDFVALDASVPIQLATTFQRAAGGAPANVAVALARLGVPAAFIGQVADDPFGRFLRQTLEDEHVDLRGLRVAPDAHTPLAFVGSDGLAGRSFIFYRDRTADTLLQPAELDLDLIGGAKVFHFGSVSLAVEPSRGATIAAARYAHQRGCVVTFDPNVRVEVWDSPVRARESIIEMLAVVDVVKVSADEVDFLTGSPDPLEAARRLRACGPSLAVVTLGRGGCYFDAGEICGHVNAPQVESVDTLGAGDAFMGGLLAGLTADCLIKADGSLNLRDGASLTAALRFANAVGAITTTRYGAIPALPTRAEVAALLAALPAPL